MHKNIQNYFYVKKLMKKVIEITIETNHENGEINTTLIGNYESVILSNYENQILISAKAMSNTSYIVKSDENNTVILRENNEIIGYMQTVEDLVSIIGVEDGSGIDIVFTKLLLEKTEEEFIKPYGEIHERVREV